jgi:hypothetical protein
MFRTRHFGRTNESVSECKNKSSVKLKRPVKRRMIEKGKCDDDVSSDAMPCRTLRGVAAPIQYVPP